LGVRRSPSKITGDTRELDDLDRELERRGHRFVCYADDLTVFVGSQRAGERVLASVSCVLEKRLKVRVNEEKSAVDRPWRHTVLGFSHHATGGKMTTISERPLAVQLAKASWIAPLLVLLMNFVLQDASSGSADAIRSLLFTVVSFGLYSLGFVFGLAALFGIRRHGTKGILVPAGIGILLSGSLLVVIGTNFGAAYTTAKGPQAKLERAAAALQSELPKRVDEETSLNRVTALEGELVYEYSLVNYSSTEVDEVLLVDTMRPSLAAQYCEQMRELLDAGFIFTTRYSGADGILVTEIVINASDCTAT